MSRIHALAALLPILVAAFAAPDETREPPLELVVKIDGQSVSISEGESARVEGTFTNPTVTVTPQPYRVFEYGGVTFRYPRGFMFEADLDDPLVKSWTLSGNDITIMYFTFGEEVTRGNLARNMMEGFGRENCEMLERDGKITLGKGTFPRTSFRVTVAGHTMVVDLCEIPSRGNGSRLLVFQDGMDEAGNRSREGKETISGIKSSFAVEE